jgi:hypothetical protein
MEPELPPPFFLLWAEKTDLLQYDQGRPSDNFLAYHSGVISNLVPKLTLPIALCLLSVPKT